ncbi:MAG TPA: hypothetical protein VF283_04570 [Bryobacteraceae bacterium]
MGREEMMEGRDNSTGSHPSLRTLALYASGDLSRFAIWRANGHVRRCGICSREVEAFRSAGAALKRSAEEQALARIGPLAHGKRLEREMTGNIAVGVAAARCVERTGRKHIGLWRGALAAVAVAAIFIVTWLVHTPKPQPLIAKSSGANAGTIIETTPGGIAVRSQGASLTILHPASAVVSLASGPGVSARYIDEETGEVTITNVYGH